MLIYVCLLALLVYGVQWMYNSYFQGKWRNPPGSRLRSTFDAIDEEDD